MLENPPVRRWPPVLPKVVAYGFANILEQRKLVYFSAFSMNRESSRDPIDIIESNSLHLPATQPKTRQ